MVSSFFGLFTAQRSLSASQTVLNVISNNIANANTDGYSRQNVSLGTSSPYPQPMKGVYQLPGTFGTGAEITTISRTRDSFLDAQFRSESLTAGFYAEMQWAMQIAEEGFMEPSESGLSTKLDTFFSSAQELSMNPESYSVRTNFIQQAVDLATVLNQQQTALKDLRTAIVGDYNDQTSVDQSKISLYMTDFNDKLDALANVNRQIITLKGNNIQPNDLLDERDRILDDLNEFMPLTFTEQESGAVSVALGGNNLVLGGTLVDTLNVVTTGIVPDPGGGVPHDDIVQIELNSTSADVTSDVTSGKCGALLKLGNYDNANPDSVAIRTLMDKMDAIAQAVAGQVNALQTAGRYIDSTTGQLVDAAGNYDEIFVDTTPADLYLTAQDISVSADLLDDPNRIACALPTAQNDEIGSGGQMLSIAQLRDTNIASLNNSTLADYHGANISSIGVEAKSINDKLDTQNALLSQISLRKEATAGVNMDEELVDLIRFQRAFEASSRVMSVMDDVLDVIINRM